MSQNLAHDESAFPTSKWLAERGMTLRDWFAGQALVGLVMDRTLTKVDEIAFYAYAIADAMMRRRAGESTEENGNG